MEPFLVTHFAGMASIPFLGHNIHHATDYNKALTLHQNGMQLPCYMSISALLTFSSILI